MESSHATLPGTVGAATGVIIHGALATLVAPASAATLEVSKNGYSNYTAVTGYFLQDEPSTNASTFNYTLSNFGLINRTYPLTNHDPQYGNLTQWQQFERHVDALNTAADRNTVYKVLFMGRHGQGYHNLAESTFGTPAWNCYWAQLTGNGTYYWEDAHLTDAGVLDAQIANRFWRHEIEVEKIPVPQSYYTSPLARCLATANITFGGLSLPESSPFVPTVKELLREGIGIHTCDHRSNKTWIQQNYPDLKFEDGFDEFDELWNGVTAESDSAHEKRELTLLDDIFTHDRNTWISLTSHSGTIRTILDVIGHQSFSLATGSVIPVLVKAKFVPASDAPSTTVGGYTTSTWCHNAPPVTSISSLEQGCVCQSTTAVLPTLDTQAPFASSNQTAPISEYATTASFVGWASKTQPCDRPTDSPKPSSKAHQRPIRHLAI